MRQCADETGDAGRFTASGAAMSAYAKGLLCAVCGVVIISPDSLLLRLIETDEYTLVMLRSAFLGVFSLAAVSVFPALRRNFSWRPILLYGVLAAPGLIFFPLSIKHTHVANTLVIIAATPIFAAVGARIFLREKTAVHTWAAALVIVVGLGFLFAGEQRGGSLSGNSYALIVSFSLALSLLVVRRRQEMAVYPGMIVAAALSAAATAGLCDWGAPISARDWTLLALDGMGVMGVSFLLVVAAARLLPPAELNLTFLLETLLGPLWVWWVLHEEPPLKTVLAGGLIVGALVAHALWGGLRSYRRKSADGKAAVNI